MELQTSLQRICVVLCCVNPNVSSTVVVPPVDAVVLADVMWSLTQPQRSMVLFSPAERLRLDLWATMTMATVAGLAEFTSDVVDDENFSCFGGLVRHVAGGTEEVKPDQEDV
jgi:hypothetical protein